MIRIRRNRNAKNRSLNHSHDRPKSCDGFENRPRHPNRATDLHLLREFIDDGRRGKASALPRFRPKRRWDRSQNIDREACEIKQT